MTRKAEARMAAYTATIERANRKSLGSIEIDITITDLGPNRQRWTGEFVSQSSDGILPDERLSVTFESGVRTTARVRDTSFDSRNPRETLVHIAATGL